MRSGELGTFLDAHFSVKHARDLPIDSIVSDFLTSEEILSARCSECDNCGRIWLQTHQDKDE